MAAEAEYAAVPVSVTVNGVKHDASVEPRTLLVYFLREQLNLTGTHVGCDTSQCGACTVLMDGRAVKSCTILAAQANGAAVTTIEDLAKDGALHPVHRSRRADVDQQARVSRQPGRESPRGLDPVHEPETLPDPLPRHAGSLVDRQTGWRREAPHRERRERNGNDGQHRHSGDAEPAPATVTPPLHECPCPGRVAGSATAPCVTGRSRPSTKTVRVPHVRPIDHLAMALTPFALIRHVARRGPLAPRQL